MNIYYVYAYLRKSDLTPYYIGKGRNNRAFSKDHNVIVPTDKSRIVFLEKNLTNLGALALERRYIRWYGRKDLGKGILRNVTDGGDGFSGLIFSKERREKISAVHKGKIVSEETRAKLSQAVKGIIRSDEYRAKMSIAKKGHSVSEETRIKMSVAKKGQKGPALSEEHRAKIGAANKGKKKPPRSKEHRDKIINANKARFKNKTDSITDD